MSETEKHPPEAGSDRGNVDEATIEAAEQEQGEPAPNPEELHLLLEDARNKADDHWNQLLRLQAESENLRKRNQRELENAHKYALEKFIQELLPVKDSLEMGLAATEEADKSTPRLQEGTELTLKMLQTVLEKFGIEEINPQDEAFDPELHQAMSAIPSEEAKPNTVLSVMQKGYLLNGRLIRPAMVVVAK